MEDEFDAHRETVDPAKAFDDLRAEVSVLRRAIEALPGAWKDNQPPNYSPDLGRLAQNIVLLATHLDAIKQHPAFALTPESHRLEMAKAGEGLMLEASRKLAAATQEAERGRDQIASLIGTARRQDKQRRWLMYTGGVALVVGIVFSPILAAMLPFGLNSRVAAFIMLEDRWNAGEDLMQAANPAAWKSALDDLSLGETNQKALTACRTEAAKTKRDQRCVISVPAQ